MWRSLACMNNSFCDKVTRLQLFHEFNSFSLKFKSFIFLLLSLADSKLEKTIIKEIEKKKNESQSEKDPLFFDALSYIVNEEQASISFLQRKLRIGYSRAARIVDQMEEVGILGPHEGSKPRSLLMSKEEIEKILEEINE